MGCSIRCVRKLERVRKCDWGYHTPPGQFGVLRMERIRAEENPITAHRYSSGVWSGTRSGDSPIMDVSPTRKKRLPGFGVNHKGSNPPGVTSADNPMAHSMTPKSRSDSFESDAPKGRGENIA